MTTRVLVVDDQPSMQNLLRQTLELSGFEVDVAKDSYEFRRNVFAKKPAIIILDILLGYEDGPQIYQQLLSEGLDPEIPVIFLSALAGDRPPTPPGGSRKYALLGKPFDYEQLVREMRQLIRSKS
ncbi:MAG: response regulator [Candidatus Omnitrophica bacterium]|nr:response regulator [Candidatus Omnitrophota bacterium]